MQQKIIEIIEFLIAEIDRLQEPHFPDLDSLSKKLLEKGYTEKDIEEAVEWISEFIDRTDAKAGDKQNLLTNKSALRMLNGFEKKMFSSEAHGFLLQIQKLGLVSASQIEQIIDRCMMIGMEGISLEEVKAVTVQFLIGKETGFADTNAVFHPGNETIH